MDQNQQSTPQPEQKPSEPVTAPVQSETTPPANTLPLQTSIPVQPKKRGSYLSGKTTALILALAAIALFFLFLAITPQTPKTQPVKTVVTTQIPMNQTVLGLEAVSTTPSALPNKTETVNVTVDTHDNAVNIVQLELAFDPTVISNVTVTPGDFLKNPVELTKGIDLKNGRISYALGISPTDSAVKGQGVFATLVFQFQPTATTASTIVSFLPKTLVGASGMNGSALKSTKNLELMVPVQGTTPIDYHKAMPPQASPSSTIKQ